MNKPILAVVNPAAGSGRCAKLLGPALDRLRQAGLKFDVAETDHPGHAIEIVRDAYRNGYSSFVAVGGDGTSYEIVNGFFPEAWDCRSGGSPRPRLGFLPLGTGNSFLRDFTDRALEDATSALLANRSRPCDVVRLSHKTGAIHYINILSLGFVADVCTLANRRFKRLGEAGYMLAVVLCLARFQQYDFKLRFDDQADLQTMRTALLIFNNSKYTGGKMMLAPNADPSDGLVDIVRWTAGRFDFISNFSKVYDGSHVNHPLVWQGRARRIDFRMDNPIGIMVDGEVMSLECESLEVLPSALDVLI